MKHDARARKSAVGGSFAECSCGFRLRKGTFPAARRAAERHNAEKNEEETCNLSENVRD